MVGKRGRVATTFAYWAYKQQDYGKNEFRRRLIADIQQKSKRRRDNLPWKSDARDGSAPGVLALVIILTSGTRWGG